VGSATGVLRLVALPSAHKAMAAASAGEGGEGAAKKTPSVRPLTVRMFYAV